MTAKIKEIPGCADMPRTQQTFDSTRPDMQPISREEARRSFESAEQAAEALVAAQFGVYDHTNPACVSLYYSVFDNLLDERLKEWKLPELLAFINP
ncbi:hypothetical protein CBA19CS22_12325 [Caballeronia novacaledonica]|uniref:Uncharacterized protein n=1 Tax=Caballeronia novacaledonica TaxID=1544861 RepID=A0ACB5QRK1_9BURK|nr:hypothetical protein CBA19CS22_12325 [Caballeronia novacaledonica]